MLFQDVLRRRRSRKGDTGFSLTFAAFAGLIGVLVGLLLSLIFSSPPATAWDAEVAAQCSDRRYDELCKRDPPFYFSLRRYSFLLRVVCCSFMWNDNGLHAVLSPVLASSSICICPLFFSNSFLHLVWYTYMCSCMHSPTGNVKRSSL